MRGREYLRGREGDSYQTPDPGPGAQRNLLPTSVARAKSATQLRRQWMRKGRGPEGAHPTTVFERCVPDSMIRGEEAREWEFSGLS